MVKKKSPMANSEKKWKIKFYLETRKTEPGEETSKFKIPIYMYVTFGRGQRLQFYTRETVFASQFDDKYLNKVKEDRNYFRPIKPQASEARSINGRLEKLALETLRLIELANSSEPPIELTVDYLRSGLKTWIDKDFKPKVPRGKTLAEALDEYTEYSKLHHAPKTVSDLKQVRDNIEEYSAKIKNQNPTLQEIDQAFIDGFDEFLIKKVITNKDKTIKKNLSNNTYCKNLKKLRTILLWSQDKGWYVHNIKIKYRENEGAILPLTFEEFELLQTAQLSSEKLERTRDVFVFGVYTALRYGDLRSLRKNDFRNGRIHFHVQKNKETFERNIKLVTKALAIIEKYKDLPGDMLLPAYSNPNKRLKEVFTEAKIERQVTLVHQFAGGRIEKTVQELSKLAHSHMQRKTFITFAIALNMPDQVSKSITGHTKDSKSYNRYHLVHDKTKDDFLDETFGKL